MLLAPPPGAPKPDILRDAEMLECQLKSAQYKAENLSIEAGNMTRFQVSKMI
jgi:hypothetical protein